MFASMQTMYTQGKGQALKVLQTCTFTLALTVAAWSVMTTVSLRTLTALHVMLVSALHVFLWV